MKAFKYKYFEVTLADGTKVQTKSPSSKLTENYAKLLCWYWINKANRNNALTPESVLTIKGRDK